VGSLDIGDFRTAPGKFIVDGDFEGVAEVLLSAAVKDRADRGIDRANFPRVALDRRNRRIAQSESRHGHLDLC